jgi:hypothetical protein
VKVSFGEGVDRHLFYDKGFSILCFPYNDRDTKSNDSVSGN